MTEIKLRKIRHLAQMGAIAATLLLPLSTGTPAEAAIPLRGIVEGFYGTPWSHSDRLEMLHFCEEKNSMLISMLPKTTLIIGPNGGSHTRRTNLGS